MRSLPLQYPAYPTRPELQCWRPSLHAIIEARLGRSGIGSYPRHFHSEWQICVMLQGDGWLRMRGVNHRTPAGCLFLVPPGEVHANESIEPTLVFRNALVSRDVFEGLADDLLASPFDQFAGSPVLMGSAAARVFASLHLATEGDADPMWIESELTLLCAGLCKSSLRGCKRTPHPSRSIVRLRDQLVDECQRSFTLTELASQSNTSPFRLVRSFTAAFGMPPHAFQLAARVERAKKQLREGRPVAIVALDCGFHDQSHLTRHFRNLARITPARFAKAMSKRIR